MALSTRGEALKPVILKDIFYAKNPSLAKWIPGFIFRYLKRVIHQDDINEMLEKYGELRNQAFLQACVEHFNVTVNVVGRENIPRTGRYVFAANHPLGGFDGIVLMNIISEYYPDFRFLVNDILMNLVPIADLFIPINKHGRQALEAARKIEDTYASDIQLLTFPAGMVSRRIKGQVMDLEWQKSFIVKSVKHQRDVIPVHFSGNCSNFFYNLANFRKSLGIKSNIEMLYLVDETWHHNDKTFTIHFGEAIPWQTFDKSKKPIEWAKWVKEKAYAMAGVENVPL